MFQDLTIKHPYASKADSILVKAISNIQLSENDINKFGVMRDCWRETLNINHVKNHPGFDKFLRYLKLFKDMHTISVEVNND